MTISLQHLPSYSSFKLPTTYSLLPKSFVKHIFLLCDFSVGKSILADSFLQLNFRSNSLSLIRIPSTLLSHPTSPVLLLSIVQHMFSMGDKLFLLLSKLGSSTPASGRLFVLFLSSGMFSDFFIVQEFPLRISLTAFTLNFPLVYIFS